MSVYYCKSCQTLKDCDYDECHDTDDELICDECYWVGDKIVEDRITCCEEYTQCNYGEV